MIREIKKVLRALCLWVLIDICKENIDKLSAVNAVWAPQNQQQINDQKYSRFRDYLHVLC